MAENVPLLSRMIQGLILFATLLGLVFLIVVSPLLPAFAFYAVIAGWFLFVVDSVLTFFRQRVSFYLGFFLSVAVLGTTLGEPAHFSIAASGNLSQVSILVLGVASQILLVALIPYHFIRERRGTNWAWPGAGSQA